MGPLPRTIVSLTPLPLEFDTRSLKIAASLSRAGYRSVVVQNRPSSLAVDDVSLEIVTLGAWRRKAPPRQGSITVAPQEDWLELIRSWARKLAPRWLRERLHMVVFILMYFIVRPAQGVFQVPRGSLYYLHEYRLFPLVFLLRMIRPAPLIYDAHDLYAEVYDSNSLSPFWKRRFLPFLNRMERWCVHHADAVVTVTDGVADLFEARFGVRPLVLRNTHDERLERSVSLTVREHLNLGLNDFLVVVVGNRKPGQIVEPTLEALSRLAENVHIVFIGKRHEKTLQLAKHYGVAGRVHAPGAVNTRSVVSYVQSADAAALLYVGETRNVLNILPNGLFQVLAAGLPLLYPALPEIKSLIGNSYIGREIDPANADSVRSALAWMLESGEEMRRMREGLVSVARKLSWREEEKTLLRLVESCLNRC